jgi:CRP-like cAMP-binding protein
VASYPRRRVEMLAEADPQLSREIRQVMFEALSRLQAQLMILGRITATEKVSSFLLTMAERLCLIRLSIASICRYRATTSPIISACRSKRSVARSHRSENAA